MFDAFMTFLSVPVWKYYISAMLAMAPAVRIFSRAGLSPAGALWLLLPWFGFVAALGHLALCKWPAVAGKGGRA